MLDVLSTMATHRNFLFAKVSYVYILAFADSLILLQSSEIYPFLALWDSHNSILMLSSLLDSNSGTGYARGVSIKPLQKSVMVKL